MIVSAIEFNIINNTYSRCFIYNNKYPPPPKQGYCWVGIPYDYRDMSDSEITHSCLESLYLFIEQELNKKEKK